ncbi:hypothetical protein [Flavicella marina]|uniref:hypothetical protein n=1 Tax=Flavicella marina TaxID=1475951 RepID=UPI0012650876|nr:hypothetical protein [Flavicella marina]
MKNLVKSTKTVLLAILTVGMLASCSSDDTSETAPIEPQEPKMINLGFEGYILTPESQLQRKSASSADSTINHTYITKGYTVRVSGGVSPDYSLFTDVDLADPAGIPIEVVGDITVTVSHPDFVETAVVEGAYYGATDISIPYASESYLITTELVQGFVFVTEGDGAQGVITNLDINDNIGKDKNKPYYTADPNIWVDITTVGNDLRGDATNNIGRGVKFTVTSSGELIQFELPEFGDPDDGNLVPTL